MRMNLDLDDQLVALAVRCSGKRTRSEAIEAALRQMIAIKQQEAIRSLRGIGWEGDLDEMRTSKYIAAE
ncbi:MAG: type II toxin-antitoxin system VapB family antitoxin [Sphingomonas phyllosphaerae]|uniref:type II toxin-antitoxin system VapB family antitoxin n=1 Tax=Sphingomonas phyllosphaerae TaxID=257003 RepID=UPI002FFCD977